MSITQSVHHKVIHCRDMDMRVVQASKMAVVSMLKSWPGLFCLCSPHNTGLTSLLNMLPLTQMEVQVREEEEGEEGEERRGRGGERSQA